MFDQLYNYHFRKVISPPYKIDWLDVLQSLYKTDEAKRLGCEDWENWTPEEFLEHVVLVFPDKKTLLDSKFPSLHIRIIMLHQSYRDLEVRRVSRSYMTDWLLRENGGCKKLMEHCLLLKLHQSVWRVDVASVVSNVLLVFHNYHFRKVISPWYKNNWLDSLQGPYKTNEAKRLWCEDWENWTPEGVHFSSNQYCALLYCILQFNSVPYRTWV